VARHIKNFLDETGGNWDWDDFTTIRITNDPQLEKIRLRCAGLRKEYPPKNPHEYCGPEGEKYLRGILLELRK
jgi:hypothetical protein